MIIYKLSVALSFSEIIPSHYIHIAIFRFVMWIHLYLEMQMEILVFLVRNSGSVYVSEKCSLAYIVSFVEICWNIIEMAIESHISVGGFKPYLISSVYI